MNADEHRRLIRRQAEFKPSPETMKPKEAVGLTLLTLLGLATLALVVWWGLCCIDLAKHWLMSPSEPPHVREELR